MKYTFLLLGIVMLSFVATAQVTLSGQVRPRAEYLHGFGSPADTGQAAGMFVTQRSRLNFNFVDSNMQLYVCLQDVRVWGNQPQLVANDGALTTVHEAWAKTAINENWGIKLGRQELSYDDQRILGAVGWAQQARSHDAALLQYKKKGLVADIGLAFNQSSANLIGTNYTIGKNYKALQFLWLNKEFKDLKASFLFMNNGVQFTDSVGDYSTDYSQTTGLRFVYAKNDLKANLATYLQTGTMANAAQSKINAYYVAADANYKVSKKFSAGLGMEMLSGNDFLNPNGENNAFMPFYGTNHKFNGLMDYFYVGNHANNVGLNDFYLTTTSQIGKFKLIGAAHYFMSNGVLPDPANPTEALSSNLGTEFDFVLARKINPAVDIKMGYSHLLPTDAMLTLKNGGSTDATSNWAWIMIDFHPSKVLSK